MEITIKILFLKFEHPVSQKNERLEHTFNIFSMNFLVKNDVISKLNKTFLLFNAFYFQPFPCTERSNEWLDDHCGNAISEHLLHRVNFIISFFLRKNVSYWHH